jgi:uncharacterized protein (TIGR02266 family)
MEKRRAARHERELVVSYRSAGALLSDWAVNVSRGGLFVGTRRPLPVGSSVILRIELGPDLRASVRGRVAWISRYNNAANLVPGMGIRFVSPAGAAGRRLLARYVAQLKRARRS